jgi:hypothetical protein
MSSARPFPGWLFNAAKGGTFLKIARVTPPSRSRTSNRIRDALQLQPLSLESLPLVYQMELEKPTAAEVDAYNKKLEAFRPTYEKGPSGAS